MLKRIQELQDVGLSLRQIEKGAKLGNGTLSLILQRKKWRKTTEEKITIYYISIIKGLMERL